MNTNGLTSPTRQVYGFYPKDGVWKSLAYDDSPSIASLANILEWNPSATAVRYGKTELTREEVMRKAGRA